MIDLEEKEMKWKNRLLKKKKMQTILKKGSWKDKERKVGLLEQAYKTHEL